MFLLIIFKIVTVDYVVFWSTTLVGADQFLSFTGIVTKATDQKKNGG